MRLYLVIKALSCLLEILFQNRINISSALKSTNFFYNQKSLAIWKTFKRLKYSKNSIQNIVFYLKYILKAILSRLIDLDYLLYDHTNQSLTKQQYKENFIQIIKKKLFIAFNE